MKTFFHLLFLISISTAIIAPAMMNLIDCDISINLVENLEEEEQKNGGKKAMKKLELIYPQLKAGLFNISEVNNMHATFYGLHYESLAHEIILPPPERHAIS